VIDAELDDEVDVEVADVVFEKLNVVAELKSVILWSDTNKNYTYIELVLRQHLHR
jgi:hypothetical protein